MTVAHHKPGADSGLNSLIPQSRTGVSLTNFSTPGQDRDFSAQASKHSLGLLNVFALAQAPANPNQIQLLPSTVTSPQTSLPLPPVLQTLAKDITQGKDLWTAYQGLTPQDRLRLEEIVGKNRLQGILYNSRVNDEALYWNGVLNLGRSLKSQTTRHDQQVASEIFSDLQKNSIVPVDIQQNAKSELDGMMGRGSFGMQVESLGPRVLEQATDWRLIAPMVFAQMAYRATKIWSLGKLAAAPQSWLTRGLGAQTIASGAGFTGEVLFFGLGSRGLVSLTEGGVLWDGKSVTRDLLATGLTLGLLKGTGHLFRQGFLGVRGLSEAQMANWTRADRLGFSLQGQLGGYLGLVGAHHAETAVGLRPEIAGTNIWLDSLGTHLALQVGSHTGRRILGHRYAALEHRLGLEAEIYGKVLEEGKSNSRGWFHALAQIFPQVGPQYVASTVGAMGKSSNAEIFSPQNILMSATGEGNGNGNKPAISASARPNEGKKPRKTKPETPLARRREAAAQPQKQIDPEQTLGMLPMGSVNPHGNEASAYLRAMGDPQWLAQVGTMNGHLIYKGDGVYADAKTGEVLNLDQIEIKFGNQIRSETGFRELPSEDILPIYGGGDQYRRTHETGAEESLTLAQIEGKMIERQYGTAEPGEVGFIHQGKGVYQDVRTGEEIKKRDLEKKYFRSIPGEPETIRVLPLPNETDWGAQLPVGLRGTEGQTEARLTEVMGLSRKQIQELSFNDSATYISGLDQFSLQGLYALYRSAVQYGARLDEIVGHNPESMALSLTAGLGGMNNLVDIVTQANRRMVRGGNISTRTDPPTSTSAISSLLIDNMQGAFGTVLGPKGAALPAGLTPESVIRVLGDNPVDVGACASTHKALTRAANAFRPAWPGQTSIELAIFGGSEASHGRLFSRPELTGFNAMRAMETRNSLEKRGGNLQDGYAPLTEDSNGFWPSEGAGVGGLMRLARMIELGLPIQGILAGFSAKGDQGNKKNPAGLGDGGAAALREALRMAQAWQGLDPKGLQYMSLHAPGTKNNNAVELPNTMKILEAFGYEGPLKAAAYKAFFGHGLGAAGAMELSLLMTGLQNQALPGAFNLQGRELSPEILALGAKVLVNSDPMLGNIQFVGGQTQGFAGNNTSILARSFNDQILHEVYGYSQKQIDAYHSRLSERQGQSREWQEDVQKGEKTIGEFLSWFGLGSETTPRKTFLDLAAPEGRQNTEANRNDSDSEKITGAPAIKKGIPVPPEKMAVSIGEGSLLTARGRSLATRSAAMRGIDDPLTLAYLAEDFRLVRYQGRNESGAEQWVRTDNGKKITAQEIADQYGFKLLQESGIRDLPLEGKAQDLPVRHGGMIPEPLRTGKRLREWMGLGREQISGTPIDNQARNLKYASDAGIYGLFVALEAQLGFGKPLHQILQSNRYGTNLGSAFPGIEKFVEMYETAHKRGRDSATYVLQSALLENARGLYLNFILPHFDFTELKTNPNALDRILPPNLQEGDYPNTGGVNLAFSQACASGLYALWGAKNALVHAGIPGELPMDAMMVMGVDATHSPFHTAPAVAGFSRKAPMTIVAMVEKLHHQGLLPPELAADMTDNGKKASEVWNALPEDLRRRAMNESSAPFTQHAAGLVVAEGGGAMPWMNFRAAIEKGLYPSSRLLGIHVNAGEGGASNLASMDQGVVTSSMVALAQAKAHGVLPNLAQLHGTSTRLNNIAEIKSIYWALQKSGMSHEMTVNAIKGLVGHTMGAASAIDMVMGVQTLVKDEAPGLFNFDHKDIDPRFERDIPDSLKQFRFSSEPKRGGIEGILVTSEGFLSSDAAAVMGPFPRDVDAAAELLRDYKFPEHVIANWKVKAVEQRDAARQREEDLRLGKITHLDIVTKFGFNPE